MELAYKSTTTLAAIRAASPCESGWKKLLAALGKTRADSEPLDLLTVLDSNGLQFCKDDRAEALVARIFKFICESNGVDPANFAPLETV